MGNGPFFEDPVYRPQLTAAQLAELRGVLNNGLGTNEPKVELLSSIFDLDTGAIVGCKGTVTPEPLTAGADAQDIKRFEVSTAMFGHFRDGTACLLRLAAVIEQSLSNELFLNSPRVFFALAALMVEIAETIIGRTKTSYRLFGDASKYQPLDANIVRLSPMKDLENWRALRDGRKRIESDQAEVLQPVAVNEQGTAVVDPAAWDKTMDEIDQALDALVTAQQISAASTGDTPLINGHIENLKRLKFSEIQAQSRAKYPSEWQSDPVWKHVEYLAYHSVYSVLLDQQGNPAFIDKFPYAWLFPSPGKEARRRLQSTGLYLSTGRYADYQFLVKGKTVKTILFGGIGGFTESGASFTWESEVQTKLQSRINWFGYHAFAAITVSEAFNSGELSVSKVRDRMPAIIEALSVYALAEILARLKNLYENYEEILAAVAEDVIKQIIVDRIKRWARDYLIKKLGKKIIPGLNFLFALQDAFDDDEIEMNRAAIACVIMATKSHREDDMTISAKILSKIAVDNIQQSVVTAIAAKAKKSLIKRSEGSAKAKAKPKPEAPKPDAPKPDATDAPADTATAKPADTTAPAKPTAKPAADDPNAARGTNRRGTRADLPTQQELERAARLAETYRQEQAKAKPDDTGQTQAQAKARPGASDEDQTKPPAKPDEVADARATGRPDSDAAVDAKATGDTDVDTTGTQAAKKKLNRGTPPSAPIEEPPLPKKHPEKNANTRESLQFYRDNIDAYPPEIQRMIHVQAIKTGRPGKPPSRKTVRKFERKFESEHGKPPSQADLDAFKKGYRAKQQRITKTDLEKIDKEIRDHYARQLTEKWGFPVHQVERIPTTKKGEDTPGGDLEKSSQAARTGKRPNLSVMSKTKAGEEVQIDEFDETRRVPREHKSSLDVYGKTEEEQDREIQEQMTRQAEFAEDHGLSHYEWVATSEKALEKMERNLAELRAQAANNPKLKERFKKIVIVEEFIFE